MGDFESACWLKSLVALYKVVSFVKVPLMKGSYFGFGSPQQQLTCMQGQKTHSLSYNMHLFLPYLLNDSQTIHSTIHFSKLLLCVMLICGDWSIGLIFIHYACNAW